MAETKIILSLEDQQFLQMLRQTMTVAKDFDETVKRVKKSVSEIAPPAATGSIKDLTMRLSEAKDKLLSLTKTSPEYEASLKRVKVLSDLLGKSSSELSEKLQKQAVVHQTANIITTGSLKDLSTRLNDAKNRLLSLTSASPGYESALRRVQVLTEHVNQANTTLTAKVNGLSEAQARAAKVNSQGSFALINLTRIVQDAPYGFIGIANNIEMAASSMGAFIATSGGFGAAMSSMGSLLMGPAGIIAGISLLTAGITMYTMHQGSAKNATDGQTEAMERQREKAEQLKAVYDGIENAYNDPSIFMSKVGDLDKMKSAQQSLNAQIAAMSAITDNPKASEAQRFQAIMTRGELVKEAVKLDLQISRIDASFDGINAKAKESFKAAITSISSIITTDAEIKKEISQIQTYLDAGNASEREKNRLLAKQVELRRELNTGVITDVAARSVDYVQGNLSGFKMEPVKEQKAPDIALTEEEQQQVSDRMNIIKTTANQLGNVLDDVFTGASISVTRFVSAIAVAVAKMFILKALINLIGIPGMESAPGTSDLSAAAAGAFSSGGFSNSPRDFARVPVLAFSGAPHYATGGLTPSFSGGIPAVLHSDEMILNRRQQTNLFNAINSGRIASNVSQRIDVRVTGEMGFNSKQFIIQLRELDSKVNKLMKVGGF